MGSSRGRFFRVIELVTKVCDRWMCLLLFPFFVYGKCTFCNEVMMDVSDWVRGVFLSLEMWILEKSSNR